LDCRPKGWIHQRFLIHQGKGFVIGDYNGTHTLFALAVAPGYETYSTGWNSLIIQQMAS